MERLVIGFTPMTLGCSPTGNDQVADETGETTADNNHKLPTKESPMEVAGEGSQLPERPKRGQH
jgi:hypothetical protein